MSTLKDNTRPLNHIIESNAKSLKADLTLFAQLDQTLKDIPVQVGDSAFAVNFEHGETAKNGFIFEGSLRGPDHISQKIPLIKAQTKKNAIEFEFTQDVDLQGKKKVYSYKPTAEEKKDYNSLRNALFHELHTLLVTEYSGEKSVNLIRNCVKPE